MEGSNRHSYDLKITWSTVLGVVSFGLLVPTFFIPLELWSQEHFISILVATVTSYMTWEGCKFIQSLVAFRFPWSKGMIGKRLTIEVLSIFLFSSVMLVAGILIYDQLVVSLEELTIGTVLRNIIVTFLIALLFTAIKEGTVLFDQWKKSLVEQERLKKEALEAKLESLKKQLDPHFLFNSLSVLSGVIHQDTELADRFITKLSQVYRYVLEHNEMQKVTLKEEIKFVESYAFLLKVRFQDKIKLEIDSNLFNTDGFLLPLSIQLLVENAVKHNKMSSVLRMRLFLEAGKVWLENDIQKRDIKSDSTGLGLSNLNNRYLLLSDTEIIVEETNEVFKVGVPLLNS